MKLFFTRTTIFILSPLKLIRFRPDYTDTHKMLHSHPINTHSQLLFTNPGSIRNYKIDPRLKAMFYVALKRYRDRKKLPSYINSLQTKNDDLKNIIKLLNNDKYVVNNLKRDDFLGYILYTRNSELKRFYRNLVKLFDIKYEKDETRQNVFIKHNTLIKAINDILMRNNILIGNNKEFAAHYAFCLKSKKEDRISDFSNKYQHMLDMIYNDNPIEECMIEDNEYWEVKLYNEMVRHIKGSKSFNKNLLEIEALTLNQRGIKQYVAKKIKKYEFTH